MSYRHIRLSKDLIKLAVADSKSSKHTIAEQIEYYYRLGRFAERYEDLPISMIKSLMISETEKADIPFSFKN